jgi:hypothetical protein
VGATPRRQLTGRIPPPLSACVRDSARWLPQPFAAYGKATRPLQTSSSRRCATAAWTRKTQRGKPVRSWTAAPPPADLQFHLHVAPGLCHQSEKFLDAYLRAGSGPWAQDDIQALWAATVWTRAGDAKGESADGPVMSLSQAEALDASPALAHDSTKPERVI